MNYKNNNIWLYAFNKVANITAARSTNNAAKTKTQGMLGGTQQKTPNLSQRDKDIRSMSTMDYMKKYHPEQKNQTTTTNQDGSVVSRSEDNKGNFVQVTTPTAQKKTNWHDAYKNNPEKVNEAKAKMEQQKFDLDDVNDEVADIESQMKAFGNSPGDMFQKKMLGIKLYDAKQRQRAAQDAYNKMQRGWRSLERRGYTAHLNKKDIGSTAKSTPPVVTKDNSTQNPTPATTPSSSTSQAPTNATPTNVAPKLNNQPTMENVNKESGATNTTPVSSQNQDNVEESTNTNPYILPTTPTNSFLDFARKQGDLKAWGWEPDMKSHLLGTQIKDNNETPSSILRTLWDKGEQETQHNRVDPSFLPRYPINNRINIRPPMRIPTQDQQNNKYRNMDFRWGRDQFSPAENLPDVWRWDRNKKITPSDLYYRQIPYYDF